MFLIPLHPYDPIFRAQGLTRSLVIPITQCWIRWLGVHISIAMRRSSGKHLFFPHFSILAFNSSTLPVEKYWMNRQLNKLTLHTLPFAKTQICLHTNQNDYLISISQSWQKEAKSSFVIPTRNHQLSDIRVSKLLRGLWHPCREWWWRWKFQLQTPVGMVEGRSFFLQHIPFNWVLLTSILLGIDDSL